MTTGITGACTCSTNLCWYILSLTHRKTSGCSSTAAAVCVCFLFISAPNAENIYQMCNGLDRGTLAPLFPFSFLLFCFSSWVKYAKTTLCTTQFVVQHIVQLFVHILLPCTPNMSFPMQCASRPENWSHTYMSIRSTVCNAQTPATAWPGGSLVVMLTQHRVNGYWPHTRLSAGAGRSMHNCNDAAQGVHELNMADDRNVAVELDTAYRGLQIYLYRSVGR